MFNKNKLIIKTYVEYIKQIEKNNNKIESLSLTNKEIKLLQKECIKYNLTNFDIYKYVKVSDLLWSKGKYNISLSSGINLNWNKFRNVLVDLYYQDIPN